MSDLRAKTLRAHKRHGPWFIGGRCSDGGRQIFAYHPWWSITWRRGLAIHPQRSTRRFGFKAWTERPNPDTGHFRLMLLWWFEITYSWQPFMRYPEADRVLLGEG